MSCINMKGKMNWERFKLEEILGKDCSLDEQLHYILDNHNYNADKLSREYCRDVCPYRINCEDNSER